MANADDERYALCRQCKFGQAMSHMMGDLVDFNNCPNKGCDNRKKKETEINGNCVSKVLLFDFIERELRTVYQLERVYPLEAASVRAELLKIKQWVLLQ